jgi:nitrite reductase (NADH) small subunit
VTAAEMARTVPSAEPDRSSWVAVCPLEDLIPDRGVCALVDGQAVAVFRCSFGAGLYAIDNLDPFSGASVLSRGLVGVTADSVPFVASPLRKQRFALPTGQSLDDPEVQVRSWPVTVVDGTVMVASPDVTSGASAGITGGQ